jgi:hypothetical protein
MLITLPTSLPLAFPHLPLSSFGEPAILWPGAVVPTVECADDEEGDDEDLGDEEDLSVAQPLADEESSFDDFDDEFDDDFEEEESDPDWDHPDDAEEEPPPAKGPGKKK